MAYTTTRYGDSEHFDKLPDEAQIDEMSPERLLEIYRRRFVNVDDLTVAIVGDVEPDGVAELAQRYIGTLGSRPSDTGIDRRPPHPPGVTRVGVDADTAAESGVEFIFELGVDLSPQLVATARVLEAVLNELLTAEVCEAAGQTYIVQASVLPLHQPTQFLLAFVVATGPSEALPEIEKRIRTTIERMANDGPAASDLTQGVTIAANDAHMGSGDFLPLTLLMRRTVGDANLPLQHRVEAAVADVTAVDVQDLARALFDSGQHIEIVRMPVPAG